MTEADDSQTAQDQPRCAPAAGSGASVYRWRAECPADDHELLKRLPAGELVKYQSLRIAPFPDTTSEAEVKSFTLEDMRNVMRQVPDGHVMVQTVQPKGLYTGERNYNL